MPMANLYAKDCIYVGEPNPLIFNVELAQHIPPSQHDRADVPVDIRTRPVRTPDLVSGQNISETNYE